MTEYISVPREKLYRCEAVAERAVPGGAADGWVSCSGAGRVAAQDVVAVFGCGGVGLGAIAAAAFRGAETIAIDMDDAKLEIARKAGAKHT